MSRLVWCEFANQLLSHVSGYILILWTLSSLTWRHRAQSVLVLQCVPDFPRDMSHFIRTASYMTSVQWCKDLVVPCVQQIVISFRFGRLLAISARCLLKKILVPSLVLPGALHRIFCGQPHSTSTSGWHRLPDNRISRARPLAQSLAYLVFSWRTSAFSILKLLTLPV